MSAKRSLRLAGERADDAQAFAWKSPENVFLLLGLLFGLLFVLLLPPLTAQDEPAHFFRAFQIAEGRFVSVRKGGLTGDYLPVSLNSLARRFNLWDEEQEYPPITPAEIVAARQVELKSGQRAFLAFSNTALYPPTAYIPQVLAIWLGRVARLRPIDLVYLARLAVLATWLALGYMSIRVIPGAQWTLFAVLLLPMSVLLSGSIAPDSTVLGLTALAVALTMRFISARRAPGTLELMILAGVCSALALSKPPYCLGALVMFALPLFALPLSTLGRKRAFVFGATALLAAFAFTAMWQVTASHLWAPARIDVPVSPAEQLSYVKRHPLVLGAAFWRTYTTITVRNIVWGTVCAIGDSCIFLPPWLRLVGLGQLAFGFLALRPSLLRFKKDCRVLVFVALPLAVFAAVNVLVYLTFSPVGHPTVEVVFGRYMLPVIVLMLPWLSTIRRMGSRLIARRAAIYCSAFAVMTLSSTAWIAAEHFYWG